MLKRDITYKNLFTNEEVTETHYFHLKESDLLEMQMENLSQPEVTDPTTGETLEGYRAMLQTVVNDQDGKAILAVVKDILRRTYGIRQGNDFLQSPEISAKFAMSQAYSKLYFTLCTDAELQAAFMNGVMPAELLAAGQEAAKEQAAKLTAASGQANADIAAVAKAAETIDDPNLKRDVQPRTITQAEAAEMDSDELQSGLATGRLRFGAPAM